MRKYDLFAGLVLLGFGGVLLYFISDAPSSAAFFPMTVLVIMTALSVILVLRSVSASRLERRLANSSQAGQPQNETFFVDVRRFFIGVSVAACYVISIAQLGFYTSSGLFVLAASIALGERRWWVVLAGIIAFLLFCYLVFGVLFERPLPPEFWLSRVEMPAGQVRHG